MQRKKKEQAKTYAQEGSSVKRKHSPMPKAVSTAIIARVNHAPMKGLETTPCCSKRISKNRGAIAFV